MNDEIAERVLNDEDENSNDARLDRLETYLDYALGIMAVGIVIAGLLAIAVAMFTSANVVETFNAMTKRAFIEPLSETGPALFIGAAVIYAVVAGLYALWRDYR